MDIDFGQILPKPTGVKWTAGRRFSASETCYDDYDSEWLSLDDNNIGHAIPGYDSNGLPIDSDWWHCLVNMRKVSAAAGHATDQGNYAKQQGDRSKTYLDQLDAEIDDEVKAQMIQKMLSPHVEGSTLVFPSTSVAKVEGSTLILSE